MAEIKATDEHGNEWAIKMSVRNEHANRYELSFSFNGCDFAINKYNTHTGAFEIWNFIEKFAKPGTDVRKMMKIKKSKKEEPDG